MNLSDQDTQIFAAESAQDESARCLLSQFPTAISAIYPEIQFQQQIH